MGIVNYKGLLFICCIVSAEIAGDNAYSYISLHFKKKCDFISEAIY